MFELDKFYVHDLSIEACIKVVGTVVMSDSKTLIPVQWYALPPSRGRFNTEPDYITILNKDWSKWHELTV